MGAIVDQRQRELAEDVTLSCHVEAPAGSGKTRLLTCRFLRLLARVDDPHEILALTFTKKAAGEMKDRISELLGQAQDGATPTDDEDGRLLELARAAVERHPRRDLRSELQLMTFHAFCGQLVRSAPARAGVALSAQVLEETDQKMLRQETARQLVSDVLRGEAAPELAEAASRRLLRLNNNTRLLEGQLADLIAARELFAHLRQEVAAHANDPAVLADYARERVERLVERRLHQTRAALAGTQLGRHWPEFHQHLAPKRADTASTVGASLPGSRWTDLARWQALAEVLLTKGGTARKQPGPSSGFYSGYAKSEWGQHHRQIEQSVCDTLHATRGLPASDQPVTDAHALLDLLRLGKEAIARYEAVLAAMNAMDFVAAELNAMAVISTAGEQRLERYLGHRINHLLVDEFQDTSRNQWELIRSLCHGWRAGDGRTLFVVGDPKQSIYGFRKAEVALFVAARAGIPLDDGYTLPLTPVRLSSNFRSAPTLIGWGNGFFEHLMRDPDPEGDEVSFQASRHPTGREGEPADGVSLTLFAKPPQKGSRAKSEAAQDATPDAGAAEASGREARWLAARVRDELERPDPPESIGILLWARTRRQVYLDALAELNIAVQVKEGGLAHDTHAGRHLVNLARALVRPHDDFAWAALLRAPWSWLPIAKLVELAGLDARGWRQRLERGSAADPAVARVVEAMAEGWPKLGREPLVDTVERTWVRLEGPMHVARREGPRGVQSCRVLLELLRAADAGLPQATLERAEQRLTTCYEPADPRAVRSPVTMMTVHGAKGLEFDVVFAPYLDRKPMWVPPEQRTPPYLLERMPPPDDSYLMAVAHDQRRDDRDPTYELLKDLHDKRKEGEARRVCYVSYTRAKQRLYLSGVVTANPDKDEVKAKGAYLGWVLEAEKLESLADANKVSTPRSGIPLELDPPVENATVGVAVEDQAPEVVHDLTPMTVQPEQVPYHLLSPSKLAKEPLNGQGAVAWPDDGGVAIARGNATHAILQRIAEGRTAPSRPQIRRALVDEGLDETTAGRLAREIAAEIDRCLKDSFLGPLLKKPQPFKQAEYQVEAEHSSREILSGSMDLVVDDGDTWWVIDYKTSRPGGRRDLDAFSQEVANRYAGQLHAYQQMLIQARGLDPARVKAGIYLTATQTWVEILNALPPR